MSAPEAASEPTLFDQTSRESSAEPEPTAAQLEPPRETEPGQRAMTAVAASLPDDDAVSGDAARDDTGAPARAASELTQSPEAAAQSERKRLAEQLEALKRKELELRRALVMADHPDLVQAIRAIESKANAVMRAESKLAQGFSKSEARRREVIDKKLASLRDKRAELDVQIGALESELGGLGSERLATFEAERKLALEQLVVALGTHVSALTAAGLDAAGLVPEITSWLPEIEALAATASSDPVTV